MNDRMEFSRTVLWRLAVTISLALTPLLTHAHEGPPFPLVLDEPLAEYRLSVWADPDIGEAKFFLVIESRGGEMPSTVPPVVFWTEPVSGRLERQTYPLVQSPLRNRLQFEAQPFFDQRDRWRVGVVVNSNGSNSPPAASYITEVESTPPGFGGWDLIIYLFPFLLLGGMWVVAVTRQRRAVSDQDRSVTRMVSTRLPSTTTPPDVNASR